MSNQSRRQKRVSKEIDSLNNDPQLKQIELLDLHPDFESATFAFTGPLDSPYEGYWFRVFVKWPQLYPTQVPKITLLDKIWNPYVNFEKNEICIDILNSQFSPALTTQKILLSIISLLGESKIEDHEGFANPKAASQMINNYSFYCNQVKKICQVHSFKKKFVFQEDQRGMGEEHYIKAEGEELDKLVEFESKDPKMCKKTYEVQEKAKQQEKMKEQMSQVEQKMLNIQDSGAKLEQK